MNAKNRLLFGTFALNCVVIFLWGIFFICPTISAAELPLNVDSEKLKHVLKHDCGSCHGLLLKGGLGPSLEKQSLSGKDWLSLKYIILNGKPGTAMPPWKSLVSENEAEWLAKYLLE